MGGIVKRSLAMVSLGYSKTIAKACGLDDATRLNPLKYRRIARNASRQIEHVVWQVACNPSSQQVTWPFQRPFSGGLSF